jgi:Ca2+-binding EF-hand superfamily protein
MSALKEKIILYNNENAKLLEKAMMLEDELKNLKRTKRIDKLFDTFELDKNGLISTKTIIELLTGNKKFDVDEKFDKEGLIKFIESVVEIHSEEENTLLENLENALQGNPVFKEDLENPLYLKIVNYFKELKEANKENKKNEKKK